MPIVSGFKTERERLEDVGWDVDANGCWKWRGEFYRQRAKLPVNEGNVNAARAMWESHYGPVHEQLEVCHACHNPACVNVNHLYLANHVRNMGDLGDKAPILPFGGGESPPARKRVLDEWDIRRARALHNTRLILPRELAMLFDVTEKTMRAALKGGSPS